MGENRLAVFTNLTKWLPTPVLTLAQILGLIPHLHGRVSDIFPPQIGIMTLSELHQTTTSPFCRKSCLFVNLRIDHEADIQTTNMHA